MKNEIPEGMPRAILEGTAKGVFTVFPKETFVSMSGGAPKFFSTDF